VSKKFDTQTCESDTFACEIHTDACQFLNIIFVRHAHFFRIHARVWFQHARVWFQHARVWFQHARVRFQHAECDFHTHECDFDTFGCDFYTQSAIFTRRVWFQHTSCDLDTHEARVWFRHANVLVELAACDYKTNQQKYILYIFSFFKFYLNKNDKIVFFWCFSYSEKIKRQFLTKLKKNKFLIGICSRFIKLAYRNQTYVCVNITICVSKSHLWMKNSHHILRVEITLVLVGITLGRVFWKNERVFAKIHQ
jgi:hypothetical protein